MSQVAPLDLRESAPHHRYESIANMSTFKAGAAKRRPQLFAAIRHGGRSRERGRKSRRQAGSFPNRR